MLLCGIRTHTHTHIAIHFWTQNAYGKCFPLRRRFAFDGPHCGNNYASAPEPSVRYIGNNSDRISEVVLRCLRIAAITRSGAAFADARSALGCTVHFLFGFLEMGSRCGSGASKIDCIMRICVAFQHQVCACVCLWCACQRDVSGFSLLQVRMDDKYGV